MAPRQSYRLADEDLKMRHKHEVMLQEYLVLQKEVVSTKRRLREAQERRQTLGDQVGFLRRRCADLLKIQAQKLEKEQLAHSQALAADYNMDAKDRLCSSGIEALSSRPSPSGQQNCTLVLEKNKGKQKQIGLEPILRQGVQTKDLPEAPPLRIQKKTKKLQPSGKRVEKRKISWQDQLVLKA